MYDKEFIDYVNILSFLLAMENLELNTEQVNNLDRHLQSQDDILKNEQNTMLRKIIEQNEILIEQNNKIIKLLENSK